MSCLPDRDPGGEVLAVLDRAADAAVEALAAVVDRTARGTRPGQFALDLTTDDAVVEVLLAAGLGVVTEEAGPIQDRRAVVVVVDPVDGSENAARGIPCFGTSLCAVDGDGPLAAVVHDHARGTRYDAVRGGGARRDGRPIRTSGCRTLERATVALSGHPPQRLGWHADRAWGAAAIELCAVAEGLFDAFIDVDGDVHGPWDYLGGLLVCREAGGADGELLGRSLDVTGWHDRRSPLVAATPELLAAIESAVAPLAAEWAARPAPS